MVHLRIDVVDRMGADIMRGFGLVPKRGAEVGGILIGTIKSDIIRIEDFEAVPCTYARGPSYLLTAAEQSVIRGSVPAPRYRSDRLLPQPHSRGTRPAAGRHSLTGTPFPARAAGETVRDQTGNAGFFVRENGVFPAATLLEFPFRRWEMTGEEPPRRAPMQERKRKEREPEKH